MPSKCMVIALILICDIFSAHLAYLGPKIAMKVILDPLMCKKKTVLIKSNHTNSAPLSTKYGDC